MSKTMKICPKCNSTKFKVNLVTEGVVLLDVTEAGIGYEVESQGELGIDNSVLTCCDCGAVLTEASVCDGMMSDVSQKYFPVEQLVQAETETGLMIMTQAEYDTMSAPSIDTMNEEQLREKAKGQETALEAMQAQMAAMMAKMEAMASGAVAPTPTAKATEKKATAAAQKATTPKATATTPKASAPAVTVQQPSVATNIPAPESVNIIDPSAITPEENIVADNNFFGSDSPF